MASRKMDNGYSYQKARHTQNSAFYQSSNTTVRPLHNRDNTMNKPWTISGPEAARILNMPYNTFNDWVKAGLITCTEESQGRGNPRRLTFSDVERAAILRAFHKAGTPTYLIKQMKAEGKLDTFLIEVAWTQDRIEGIKHTFDALCEVE